MAVHHGGKVGKAGKTLASKSSSKTAKSKAGTTLASDASPSEQSSIRGFLVFRTGISIAC